MSKQSRDKILETATRLFYLQGYHGTGLSQILKESGAPKGSLYHYFPGGKEQLALEAIANSRQNVGEVIQYYMKRHPQAVDAFQEHVWSMAELFHQKNGVEQQLFAVMPFGLLAAESAFVNNRLRQACEDTFEFWESQYFQKLIDCQYEENQATIISTALSAMIEGAVTLSLTKQSNEPLLRVHAIIPSLLQHD